jgi:hypothetical protein
MSKHKVNFLCPMETVKVIDDLAEADHRDRTSMLNRIIDFYLSHNDNQAFISQVKANGRTKKKVGGSR